MTAVAWDEAKHPRRPSGDDQGGEFAPKGSAPASRSIRPRMVPGYVPAQEGWPAGIFSPEDSVVFWPEKIAVYSGGRDFEGPMWKALVDAHTGEELAFYFAGAGGRPHHGYVLDALRNYKRFGAQEFVAGYGNKAMRVDPASQIPQSAIDAIALRHRKDILDAREMVEGQGGVAAAGFDPLTAAFDPALHPHRPAGSPQGGEWAPKGASDEESIDSIYGRFGMGDEQIAIGVRAALDEMPDRLTHGDTGKHGFFLVNGRVVAWKDWTGLSSEDRAVAVPVHSHAPDGTYSLERFFESNDPLSVGDLKIMQDMSTKGESAPRMVVLQGNGTMDILSYTTDTNMKALHRKGRERLQAEIFGSRDEVRANYEETGQPTVEYQRARLRSWAAENGFDYREGVPWATRDEVEDLMRKHSTPIVAAGWDPSKHPHRPAGSSQGGEWAPKDTRPDIVREDEMLRDLRGIWDLDDSVLFWPQKIGYNEAGEPLWKAIILPDGSDLFWFADEAGRPHHNDIAEAFTDWDYGQTHHVAGFGDGVEIDAPDVDEIAEQSWLDAADIERLAVEEKWHEINERYGMIAPEADVPLEEIQANRAADLLAPLQAVPKRHRRDINDARAMLAGPLAAAAGPSMGAFSVAIHAAVERMFEMFGHKLTEEYADVLNEAGDDAADRFSVRASPIVAAGWDESQHPRDPGGEGGGEFIEKGTTAADENPREEMPWKESLTRLDEFTADDVRAGRVPGIVEGELSSHVAAHARDVAITVAKVENGHGAYLESGKLDTVLLSHEAGHYVANEIQREEGVMSIPELDPFKVDPGYEVLKDLGNGRIRVRTTEGAEMVRYAKPVEYENPFGLNNDPSEIMADVYSELLNGGEFESPDDDPYVAPRKALLNRVARTAKKMGLPDKRLYRVKEGGAERIVGAGPPERAEPVFQFADDGHLVEIEKIAKEVTERAGPLRQMAVAFVADAALESVGISLDLGGVFSERILARSAVRAADMGATVQDAVTTAVKEGLDEGWSVPQTADAIREQVREVTPAAANMLARTDLNGLANAGSIAVARIAWPEGDIYKRWINADDNRVRPTHAHADVSGQTVPINHPFMVGGVPLDFPGDPDGPDREVCNCRCTVVYVQALTAAAWDPALHPHRPAGDEHGGEWAPKDGGWTGPALAPEEDFVGEVMEKWIGDSRWVERDGEDFLDNDPLMQAMQHGMTDEEYRREVGVRAKEWLDNAYVATRVPGPLLDEIVADGRLKSQFETASSGGTLSPEHRRYSEERMFGYDPELADADRPIYGYMHQPHRTDTWTDSYGEVELELKNSIRTRTTWTDGDSFAQRVVPSPIENPSYLSTDNEYGADPLKESIGNGYYVEAQMHGGVSLDDVAAVHVPYDWREDQTGIMGWYEPDKAKVIAASLERFEEMGIPVEYDRGQQY